MRMVFSLRLSLLLFIIGCASNTACQSGDSREGIGGDAPESGYSNPVFEPVLADPSVVYDEQTHRFYAYGTQDDWADGLGSKLVPILESKNLTDWKYLGDAFTEKPDWKPEGGIWAPDINQVGKDYYLYYAYSTWGDKNPGIGLAIADNPAGPFLDQGKLFDSKEMEVPNSIDPFFYAEGATKYLFWGSYSDLPTQGTYAIALSDDAKKIEEGAKKVKIAAGDVEAVMIHKHGNYYYFFGSKGACCDGANSTYHVVVARSDRLLGPYEDKEGNKITERGNGSIILESGAGFVGPGHVSEVVRDHADNDWMLYHAINPENGKLSNGTSRRMLMLDELRWEDGWPSIKNSKPANFSEIIPEF